MSRVTTIVLAGGARDDVCRNDVDAVNKAFVRIGGSPLVTRVLRALREAQNVGHLIVVAPDNAPSQPLMLADETRSAGNLIGDSLRNGMRDLNPNELVLISAADLPFVSPTGTDDFIAAALSTLSDVCYGYVERLAHEARYPTLPHTWARLQDGIYCGAGFCAIRPRALLAVLAVLEQLAAARKAPWRLASLFGPAVLLRYAVGILSIAELEKRASAILGHAVRGVITTHAELAVNIDRFSDIERVEKLLVPQTFPPKHPEKT